nr:putative reverse transcriptase domain-containing protein [Tanacetum cinerariifolium]
MNILMFDAINVDIVHRPAVLYGENMEVVFYAHPSSKHNIVGVELETQDRLHRHRHPSTVDQFSGDSTPLILPLNEKEKVKIKAFASKSLRNVGSEEFNISYTGSLTGSNKGRNLKEEALSGANEKLETGADGIKYLNRRAWIPKVNNLRKVVMDEAHRSRYSIHPGADKMYMDVKESYWWPGMKRNIAIYVGKCLT